MSAAHPEAHESLISRKTSAEVPLTGLSFIVYLRDFAETLLMPCRPRAGLAGLPAAWRRSVNCRMATWSCSSAMWT